MKLFLLSILFLAYIGLSFQKNNPFVGNWDYYLRMDDEDPSAVFSFTDTTSISFFYLMGVELTSTKEEKYYYTDNYLIWLNNTRADTMIYNFISSDKLMIMGLNYMDTLLLIKAD